MVGKDRTLEKKCFICNEIRTVNNEAYNDGGLERITCEDTAHKMQERKNIFIVNKESLLFQAAKRFDFSLSGSTYDVFAADVFYHQSCYIKFLIKPVKLPSSDYLLKKQSRICLRFI